jgi:hypothetical protein
MTTTAPAAPSKYSKAFWLDLLDRSVSTAAQAGLGLATAVSFNLLKPDLSGIAAVVGTATLISVLKAFAVARTA